MKHTTHEANEELTMRAGRMRAALELAGEPGARVWCKHGRIHVYFESGHVRLHSQQSQLHAGSARARAALRPFLYFWD